MLRNLKPYSGLAPRQESFIGDVGFPCFRRFAAWRLPFVAERFRDSAALPNADDEHDDEEEAEEDDDEDEEEEETPSGRCTL